jgi:hypothetical protein
MAVSTIKVASLAGVAEIADLFRIGRTTVSNWDSRRDRNGFPERVKSLASGPLYDVEEVVAWYITYEPSKGGRPGTVPVRGKDGRFKPAPRTNQ